MLRLGPLAALAAPLVLAACAVAPPTAPSVVALPAKDKSLADFQQDDLTCRQYAAQQFGAAPPQPGIEGAALGTVLGAAAGAAIGAAAGNPAAGAAIGGGTGLLVGSAEGAAAAGASSAGLQWQYDIGYAQCMVSKGDSVPAFAGGGAPGSAYWPYAYAGYPGPYPYAYPYPYPYYSPFFFGSAIVVARSHRHHEFHHRHH